MATLPVLSVQEVVRRFEKLGWRVARQSSSHIIMTKVGEVATLSRRGYAVWHSKTESWLRGLRNNRVLGADGALGVDMLLT